MLLTSLEFQKADEKASQLILLYVSTIVGCVDLHGNGVPWGLSTFIHSRQVQMVIYVHLCISI